MKKLLVLLITSILILSSCVGVEADIQMRKDGSGKIIMEYRFSRMAETIGRLDGNERWNIIPTGRADMERTVARINGMKLVSFSTREQSPSGAPAGADKDIVNRATLEFKDPEALLKFLDPSGKNASLTRGGNSNKLTMKLNKPASSQINADLLELARQLSAGYKLKISFSAPGICEMAITNSAGKVIAPPTGAQIVPKGKKVSLVMDTGNVLEMDDGLGVEISW